MADIPFAGLERLSDRGLATVICGFLTTFQGSNQARQLLQESYRRLRGGTHETAVPHGDCSVCGITLKIRKDGLIPEHASGKRGVCTVGNSGKDVPTCVGANLPSRAAQKANGL